MCDQMKPQTAQLEKLAAAAAALRQKHHQALDGMLGARQSFENQLQQLSVDSDAMQVHGTPPVHPQAPLCLEPSPCS